MFSVPKNLENLLKVECNQIVKIIVNQIFCLHGIFVHLIFHDILYIYKYLSHCETLL